MAPAYRILSAIALLIGFVSSPRLLAQPPAKDKKAAAEPAFIRLERDAKQEPSALQTAIVRYVPARGDKLGGGVVVDLVAAVHVGDRDYYEKLNKLFEDYDVVLYELVAQPGTRVPKGGKRERDNPLAFIQRMMKFALDLESQVEIVDYTKKNFVHADLSPEQMMERIRERGDDAVTLALGIAADLLRRQNLQDGKVEKKPAKAAQPTQPPAETDFLTLLFDPDGPRKLKRVMAESLGDPTALAGLGQTLNTILVSDRNQAALKVFQKELAAGRKKIAIFYGAAHMPDFEKRLQADFGLKRESEKWLTAWELK